MNNKINICISCGSKKIEKCRDELSIAIKGRVQKVPNIEYYACLSCGEKFTDIENETKIDVFLKNKRAKVA